MPGAPYPPAPQVPYSLPRKNSAQSSREEPSQADQLAIIVPVIRHSLGRSLVEVAFKTGVKEQLEDGPEGHDIR